MPASIFQGLFEILFQGVIEIAAYYIGRVVVPMISLGRWKCDRMLADTPRRKLRAAGFYHLRGKQVYLTAEATQVVGMVSLFLMVGVGIWVWYMKKG